MARPTLVAGTVSSNSTTSSTRPQSFTYDAGAADDDRCLVVFVPLERDSSPEITAITVTYNSVSLTQQVTQSQTGGQAFTEFMSMFTLENPATGSNTLTITQVQNNSGQDLAFTAAIYKDVDQTTPVGVTASRSRADAETDVDVDITTTTSDSTIIVAGVRNRADSGPFTPNTDNTELDDYSVATTNLGFSAFMNEMDATSTGTYSAGSEAQGGTAATRVAAVAAIELLSATVTTPKSLSHIGVGTASLTTEITITKAPSMTAIGTSSLTTSIEFSQLVSMIGTGTSTLATLFIAGVAGTKSFVKRIAIKLGLGL